MIKLNHIPKRDEFNSKFYYEPAKDIKVAIIFNPKKDEWVGIGYCVGNKRCGLEIYEEEIDSLLTMNELVG